MALTAGRDGGVVRIGSAVSHSSTFPLLEIALRWTDEVNFDADGFPDKLFTQELYDGRRF